jgi:adenosine deaminase
MKQNMITVAVQLFTHAAPSVVASALLFVQVALCHGNAACRDAIKLAVAAEKLTSLASAPTSSEIADVARVVQSLLQ